MRKWWWKGKTVFHHLQYSLEFNFCIFSGVWEGTCVSAEIFRIQMTIKGKMNMLNVKPIIHDCQHNRWMLNLFRYNKLIFCWHALCLLYTEFRSYMSFFFFTIVIYSIWSVKVRPGKYSKEISLNTRTDLVPNAFSFSFNNPKTLFYRHGL